MRIVLVAVVFVCLGGCVGFADAPHGGVSIWDCKRWESGRLVHPDIAGVCQARARARYEL